MYKTVFDTNSLKGRRRGYKLKNCVVKGQPQNTCAYEEIRRAYKLCFEFNPEIQRVALEAFYAENVL